MPGLIIAKSQSKHLLECENSILILLLNGLTVFSYNNTFFDSDLILSFYFCLGASIWEEILLVDWYCYCVMVGLEMVAKIPAR